MGKSRWWVAVAGLCLCWMQGWAQAETVDRSPEAVTAEPVHVEHPAWFKASFLDIGEEVREAASHGRRLLLYFYQNGCPYCKKLVEDNFGDPRIAAQTRELFDVVAINMWGDRTVTAMDGSELSEKEFAARMRVMYTPTLVFFDEQGGTALRLNGYYQPRRFVAALDYAAGKAPQGLDLAGYMRQRLQRTIEGIGVRHESFMMSPPYLLARNRITAQRPLAVLFEQADCPSCDEFHRDVLARPEIRERLGKFDVVGLDRWADTPLITPNGERSSARRWAEELGVEYTPSLVFFDENGAQVFRAEAYLKTFHTGAALDYVASGAYRQQPSFQRFVQEIADHLREQGKPVDLWQ